MNIKLAAILLTGGSGTRFGSPLPKQFHKLGGKTLYLYTLDAFIETNLFHSIILPVPAEWKEEISKELSSLYPNNSIQVISGGATRQESSYLALQSCPLNTEFVVIHDAVRPFISSDIIKQNVSAVLTHKAVDTCVPSFDTLVHSKEGTFIDAIPLRKELFRGQTPQSFSYPLIMKAHEQALARGINNSSDDCKLILDLGHPVHIVPGEDLNIKITTDFDLFLAEQILYKPRLEKELPCKSSLKGKIFAVTGASGGIGKSLCQELKQLGATTIEISQNASSLQADLTNYQETEKVFRSIARTYGDIDGLINSIGTFQVKDFPLLSEEEIQTTIASNLTSTIYCCKHAQIKKGGHIINISSSSYSKGRKECLVYSATKAAVVNFTQGLAATKPDLFVHVIVPQRTDTPLRRAAFPFEDKNSLLQPEEIAQKISQLLTSSPRSGSILEVRKTYIPTHSG
ncbi:MAG: bifunctional cytidylyltransferase/SDR family oxidoreductase [Rhabdochlamydiaceae bacterium]|nr:bifunctional cytidylyltransferase/SDR family oxidoreductase [Rhabdochlamydiaceae bacterium]